MVKGVARQIILVDSPDPRLFEKAIFILKDGRCGASPEDLLLEAQQIAADYLRDSTGANRRGRSLWPLLYAVCGASITGIVWLAVSFL